MHFFPDMFVQEKDIPGVAQKPHKRLFKGVYKKGFTKDGWRKIKGHPELPIIRVCGECDSAFHVASYLSENNLLAEWDSVIVASQREGVGQYGRKWFSPEGNLYLVWRLPADFPGKEQVFNLLPLLLGAAFVDFFDQAELGVDIKWPNDLVMNDRKIGGMLIKSQPGLVLAGIGINIVHAPDASLLREGASLEPGILAENGFVGSPHDFWRKLFQFVFPFMAQAFVPEWVPDLLDVLDEVLWRKGQEVRVYPSQGESFSATLLGLAKDGGLRLATEKGEEILYSGSIGLP